MTTFDDRLQAELARYYHDQELAFKVRLRRDKLFGLEIARRMGMATPEALAYAKTVVVEDLQHAGDAVMLKKVVADLEAQGLDVDEVGLQRELRKLNGEAQAQVNEE
ncbi:MAG: DUF1476 domain-containing protein [Pseudomonadota bacterium]